MELFQLWESRHRGGVIEQTLVAREQAPLWRKRGLLGPNPVLVLEIFADSLEDATRVQHRHNGWPPPKPA